MSTVDESKPASQHRISIGVWRRMVDAAKRAGVATRIGADGSMTVFPATGAADNDAGAAKDADDVIEATLLTAPWRK